MTTSYEKSIKWQKAVGTYDRNQHIKELRQCGFTFDAIGRRFNLSRQRIEQIVNNPFATYPQMHQNGKLRRFRGWLRELLWKFLHTDISIGE